MMIGLMRAFESARSRTATGRVAIGRLRGGGIGNLQGRVMPLFSCSGYPDFEAGNAREAARFFADRRAKSEYGAGGQCTFLAATAGSVLTFQAFIGNYRGPGLTADRNVSITVEQQEN